MYMYVVTIHIIIIIIYNHVYMQKGATIFKAFERVMFVVEFYRRKNVYTLKEAKKKISESAVFNNKI